MPSTQKPVGVPSTEFCCPATKMKTCALRRFVIAFVSVLLVAWMGCHGGQVQADVPDDLSGVVLDQVTGTPLQGVLITIFIHERSYVSVVGPEGVVKPRLMKAVDAKTNVDGLFSMDLRKLKAELKKSYPNYDIVMGKLAFCRAGYVTATEPYTEAGQTFRLKRELATANHLPCE